MSKKEVKLDDPKSIIDYYNKVWKTLEDYKYSDQEQALVELMSNYKDDNSLNGILLKCAVINDFYSTNIFAIHKMAKHIHSIKCLDNLYKDEIDYKLVEKIATIKVDEDKNKKMYSFATKYCSFHNSNYPIYDNYVERCLRNYNYQDKFYDYKFTRDDLKDYKIYKDVYDRFINYYGLNKYSYKQVDRFLWTYGRKLYGKDEKE